MMARRGFFGIVAGAAASLGAWPSSVWEEIMFISDVRFGISAIIGWMAFATTACTTDVPLDAYSNKKVTDVSCSTAREIAASVSLRSVDPTYPASSFFWRSEKNEIIKIENVRQIYGSCAARLSGFLSTNLYFGEITGLSGFVGRPEVVQPPLGTKAEGFDAIRNHGTLAPWKMGQFVTASRIGDVRTNGKLSTVYVGLWRNRAHSYLGVFHKNAAGHFDEPSWLGISDIPIRSISYFPAYDVAAGRLGILQEGPEGLRLINVDWMHPDL